MMFWVNWIGTKNGEYIEAENMKSAKWIFALKNGINSIGRVTGRKVKEYELKASQY